MSTPLKLIARDDEDLQVVAGFLQDAIVPVGEMCFLPGEKRFAMVVNRFRWEAAPEPMAPAEDDVDASFEDGVAAGVYERTHCALCFDGISAARLRGFDLRDRARMLCLLTIAEEGGAILLHFSGGASIRLEGAGWCLRVADMGEPWPTTLKPDHPLDGHPLDDRAA
ncbi:DUF2948 family protein [Arenibaculum sp.]|uniref:DUF2948 family protein n=1 Tax=Arenibaculum sp. TaxID=2865862 RepID=UPI002E163428|nr:DUF2948 family protein [Arenibaculum sp.]